MSQSNLATQPNEMPPSSQEQAVEVEKPTAVPSISAPKLGQQKNRSPEQQAKVDRIGQIDPFVGVQRDEDLFTALNHWRELGICARVTTMDRLGLAKSLTVYTRDLTKRRSGLLMTPAPVAYIEIEQHGSPTDLFLSILKFLVNPLDCGHLRQLRSRAWGTLSAYQVKMLIVNNADQLSFSAFNELMRVAEKLRISVVLAGSPNLNEILDPKAVSKSKYINIHNTFLKFHQYRIFNKEEILSIINAWEKELRWAHSLDLCSDKDIVMLLSDTSQGQLRALYENLREIAVWKVDHPQAQINPKNISQVLQMSYLPVSKL